MGDSAAGGDESPPPGKADARLLSLRVRTLPASRLVPPGFGSAAGGSLDGVARFGAHMVALAGQLQALRYAALVALRLGRELVVPQFTCHCDRDPTATLGGVLREGCKLPTTEAEEYLPFECPVEHVLDTRAWQLAARADRSLALHSPHVADSITDTTDRLERAVSRGIDVARLATSISSQLAAVPRTPRLVELVWPEVGSEGAWQLEPPAPASLSATELRLEQILAGSANNRWCVSCSQTHVPAAAAMFGHAVGVAGTESCRWCANATRLLAYRGHSP